MSNLTVSVVIPVHNSGDELRQSLDAIAASSCPISELILVDDASTDGTTDRLAESHSARVIHLLNNQGPAAARNRGVEQASGDIIFFVDADVLVHTDALGIAVDLLQSDPQLAAVFGSYDDKPGHHSFLSQYRNLFHHWVHQTAHHEASTFWAGCGAIRREIFLEMGGFDSKYRKPSIEDIELGSRLRRSGHRIRLEKTMLCKHLKQWRFWNLVRTDIMERGFLWMLLLLQDRQAPLDLNLSLHSRIATVLMGLLVCSVPVFLLAGHAAALAPAAAFLLAAAASTLFTTSHAGIARIKAILVLLAPFAAYLPAPDVLAFIPMMLILLLVWSHLDFYRFAVNKRGFNFALGIIPMHVVFFIGCAVSGVMGLFVFVSNRVMKKDPSGEIL